MGIGQPSPLLGFFCGHIFVFVFGIFSPHSFQFLSVVLDGSGFPDNIKVMTLCQRLLIVLVRQIFVSSVCAWSCCLRYF